MGEGEVKGKLAVQCEIPGSEMPGMGTLCSYLLRHLLRQNRFSVTFIKLRM